MENEEKTGIFLNGKAQIIEMLQFMGGKEKETLINNIKLRNPQLANELLEKSFTFKELVNVDTESIQQLFRYTKAAIWGLALQGIPSDFQRKILSLAPRSFAEEAYSIMMTNIKSERIDSKRAQNKIVSTYLKMKQRIEFHSTL